MLLLSSYNAATGRRADLMATKMGARDFCHDERSFWKPWDSQLSLPLQHRDGSCVAAKRKGSISLMLSFQTKSRRLWASVLMRDVFNQSDFIFGERESLKSLV